MRFDKKETLFRRIALILFIVSLISSVLVLMMSGPAISDNFTFISSESPPHVEIRNGQFEIPESEDYNLKITLEYSYTFDTYYLGGPSVLSESAEYDLLILDEESLDWLSFKSGTLTVSAKNEMGPVEKKTTSRTISLVTGRYRLTTSGSISSSFSSSYVGISESNNSNNLGLYIMMFIFTALITSAAGYYYFVISKKRLSRQRSLKLRSINYGKGQSARSKVPVQQVREKRLNGPNTSHQRVSRPASVPRRKQVVTNDATGKKIIKCTACGSEQRIWNLRCDQCNTWLPKAMNNRDSGNRTPVTPETRQITRDVKYAPIVEETYESQEREMDTGIPLRDETKKKVITCPRCGETSKKEFCGNCGKDLSSEKK